MKSEMMETSTALDEAFERLGSAGFELPNGFINHGPMACEALAAVGREDALDSWARRFANVGGVAVDPVAPVDFDWHESLGSYQRLPEWIGYFERSIAEFGWPTVVEIWVPRLLPSLAIALFHAAIRTAHAVRALDAADTEPRQAELARALGYWAARFEVGQPVPDDVTAEGEIRLAVINAAAEGARHYLSRPNILNLHGVTGAMAVELFVDHIPIEAGAAGLAQVRAEHAALYARGRSLSDPEVAGVEHEELVRSAEHSGDPHQVKLVEACLRGLQATDDPAFAAAAELVTLGR
ncbi:MAG TPA: hypothetical protein VHZ02_01855 [Acidimicrobiales bacterium]|jgi:hypothetical protein|nr:hypothetical protein [Acidimicrobiales bacterium]